PHHLTLIALAVALGLGVTAWWVVRGDAVGQPVSAPVAAPVDGLVDLPDPGAGTPPAAGSPAAGEPNDPATATGEVVVDVAGRVRRPGIVVLPAGSRVADALERAGGVKPRVDLAGLNLARVLVDGEQVLVGLEPAAGSPAGSAPGSPTAGAPATGAPATGAAGALVSINTADQPTLETLPGVGPVTAGAILEWRSRNGAFSSVEELVEVNGIGPATLARLLPLVTL
ncbi:helix-hairpin-helix domain-containing protein, partial [Nocardioides sp.]|uniref:helix-hairpin-helix domain-containing protein n=1 Tax=Nocardioides sp. TaxID=35761 RepID=UPI002734A9BC